MAYDIGIGLAVPHEKIANLWVREIDETNGDLVLTGLINGMGDNTIDTTTLTYSHGCLLTQVDGVTNLSGTWENIGTAASPAWQRWDN